MLQENVAKTNMLFKKLVMVGKVAFLAIITTLLVVQWDGSISAFGLAAFLFAMFSMEMYLEFIKPMHNILRNDSEFISQRFRWRIKFGRMLRSTKRTLAVRRY